MANQFSGDFTLEEVYLYTVYNTQKIDIKNLVLEINLFESVLSSALQVEVLIQDIGQNLISTLPIVGQERLQIKIGSRNKIYDLNYYLYKIDSRTIIEKDQTYIMHGVSIEGLRNENFRICERIDGEKSEDVIENVLRKSNFSTKKLQKDSTVFPFDMYVPNWRVFDFFNWMSIRSIPEYKKDSHMYLDIIIPKFEEWAKSKGAVETCIGSSTALKRNRYKDYLKSKDYKDVGFIMKKEI